MTDGFHFDRKTLADDLRNGRYVPFLGAGCSQCEQVPSTQELSDELAGMVSLSPTEAGRPEKCKCESKCDCSHWAIGLDAAASYFVAQRGRLDLDDHLQSRFRHSKPLPLHEYLAALKNPRLIITTNYDRLMEQALFDTHKPFDVLALMPNEDDPSLTWISYDDAGQMLSHESRVDAERLPRRIDLRRRTLVYKIHGSQIDGPMPIRSKFLITQQDYEEALLRLDQFLPPAILEYLDGRRLLFLGSGLRDWNVRALMRRLLRFVSQPSHAVLKSVSGLELEVWRERLKIEEASIETLVEELRAVDGE